MLVGEGVSVGVAARSRWVSRVAVAVAVGRMTGWAVPGEPRSPAPPGQGSGAIASWRRARCRGRAGSVAWRRRRGWGRPGRRRRPHGRFRACAIQQDDLVVGVAEGEAGIAIGDPRRRWCWSRRCGPTRVAAGGQPKGSPFGVWMWWWSVRHRRWSSRSGRWPARGVVDLEPFAGGVGDGPGFCEDFVDDHIAGAPRSAWGVGWLGEGRCVGGASVSCCHSSGHRTLSANALRFGQLCGCQGVAVIKGWIR